MSFFNVLLIAVALGVDALSVAIVIGIRKFSIISIAKISGYTGVFHILMPLFGLFIGNFARNFVRNYFYHQREYIEHVFELVGAGILLLLGMYMIVESFMERKKDIDKINFTGGVGLITVTLGVSIDAFSVGISLGMMDFHIYSVFVFGIVATLMMGFGLFLGSKIGDWLGRDLQIWGGLVLIYLGLRFSGLLF